VSTAEILDQVRSEFKRRKFAAGLAITFIDFLDSIGALDSGLSGYDAFLSRFPRRELTERGDKANTLIVELPDGMTKSIRQFYDRVQNEIRSDNFRLDFPSAAPHATQAWKDYTNWLDAMVAIPKSELVELRASILAFVLSELPSHELDESLLTREPPVFSLILSEFDLGTKKGEPTGAAFQGAVFGYLRADAPHLQVEVRKVRTGSTRVGGIGDIDAWDGDLLILSAEAKHTLFLGKDVSGIEGFCNKVVRHKAIGLVIAEEFEAEARRLIKEKGLTAISREELQAIAALWDPLKQQIAARAFLYYASHVEQNGALTKRLKEFLRSNRKSLPEEGGTD
jgi:hypothetical protein